MVNEASLIGSDPVYRRLAEVERVQAGGNDRAFSWLDREEKRAQMRRNATRCAAGAWALMTFFAIASSVVAFVFLKNVTEIFSLQESYFDLGTVSNSSRLVPVLLGIVGAALFVFGGIALLLSRFPGLRSTQVSIDWATSCDAVAQLLSTGCSYSDSFRAASQLMPKSIIGSFFGPIFGSRENSYSAGAWLASAADRVDAGRDVFEAGNALTSDELKLRLLVQSNSQDSTVQDSHPEQRWQAAADHFILVADQRLGMLTHSLPPIATILSGIMLWISISATLGWMWRSVVGLLRDLGGGL